MIFAIHSGHILDRSSNAAYISFGRSKRALGQLRSFLDLGPKSSCPLDDRRIGLGVAYFEITGNVGIIDLFLERAQTDGGITFADEFENGSHGGL